jgi:hypothetical protein
MPDVIGTDRGEIETVSSGSLRVKVYAGIDPNGTT